MIRCYECEYWGVENDKLGLKETTFGDKVMRECQAIIELSDITPIEYHTLIGAIGYDSEKHVPHCGVYTEGFFGCTKGYPKVQKPVKQINKNKTGIDVLKNI